MLLLLGYPVVGKEDPGVLSRPLPLDELLLLITDVVEMLLQAGQVLRRVLLQ